MGTLNPENKLYLQLHQKHHGQQVRGGDSTPLLHSGETPLEALHPALGLPAQGRYGPAQEGWENDQKAEASL